MAAISSPLAFNTPIPDHTQPFVLSYEPQHVYNKTRSNQLLTMLIQSGIQDPLGFMFSQSLYNYNTRIIQILPSTPYYRVKYKNSSSPTLIQVPMAWIQNLTLLKHKVEQFLQIPPDNTSRVKIKVSHYSTLFRKLVDLQLIVKGLNTTDAVVIDFGYLLSNGFSETVSILYTSNLTNINSESNKYYYEATYSDELVQSIFWSSFFYAAFSVFFAFFIPPFIFVSPKISWIQNFILSK